MAGRTSDPPPPTCMHMTFLLSPMQWRRSHYQGGLDLLGSDRYHSANWRSSSVWGGIGSSLSGAE